MSFIFGVNVNQIRGNTDWANIPVDDPPVMKPQSYLFKTDIECFTVTAFQVIKQYIPCMVSTIAWLDKYDPTEATQYIHCPLTTAEVERIQALAWALAPVPFMLKWGPLGQGDPVWWQAPPVSRTLAQLVTAYEDSLWAILMTGRGLPSNAVVDLMTEFDMGWSADWKTVMTSWYPWARSAVETTAGLVSTVSTIADPDDASITRVKAVYDWLAGLGYGLPARLCVHLNAWTNSGLATYLPTFYSALDAEYSLPIMVGEIDTDLNVDGLYGLGQTNLTEVLLWRK